VGVKGSLQEGLSLLRKLKLGGIGAIASIHLDVIYIRQIAIAIYGVVTIVTTGSLTTAIVATFLGIGPSTILRLQCINIICQRIHFGE